MFTSTYCCLTQKYLNTIGVDDHLWTIQEQAHVQNLPNQLALKKMKKQL
jgi:hypothetical protein